MNRDDLRQRAFEPGTQWDLAIVGGGASGVGIAIDAAQRGYRTVLFEQHDFGKGTSSRSTKLVHGGVRYLAQGNLSLVTEALHERGLLRQNAPHLVHDLPFIVPGYAWWEKPYYGLGLKTYDLLAGKLRFGKTRLLSKSDVLARIPTIKSTGLRGGVVYSDGQFDDTRLLINMATTAVEQGATLLNYAAVKSLRRNAAGKIDGLTVEDREAGATHDVSARVVINATGPFCDGVRKLADNQVTPLVSPSQGIHLVFARSFLPSDHAIMVPKTSDGRVMFAIPWHNHTLVGTTDVAIPQAAIEPQATETEIDFILETAGRYLERPPTRADILCVFAGIRPLVKATGGKSTAALSRDHTIHVDDSQLITITGGKWTTYRHMAEDCTQRAAEIAGLPPRACRTRDLHLHGYHAEPQLLGDLAVYGSDAAAIRQLAVNEPPLAARLHPDLSISAAEVVWAARQEMARTIEDVLARRTRMLFLNARAAIDSAPHVAELLASELKRDQAWQAAQVSEFEQLAAGYLPPK
jgi:glycerol-3-phosphate dehydrogenase